MGPQCRRGLGSVSRALQPGGQAFPPLAAPVPPRQFRLRVLMEVVQAVFSKTSLHGNWKLLVGPALS